MIKKLTVNHRDTVYGGKFHLMLKKIALNFIDKLASTRFQIILHHGGNMSFINKTLV